ncbi:hypothetical protein AVEN_50008-1 [Araneus ventricosus]|uniref:Uncharacterized protein n=1 Tax=Araneus ventricosus TaxID=182803 RepID=A0A4Y2D0R2_ARAVE|nr:hypothetical protein AVEN_50008-1 [Araneus ventricosus]
MEKNVAVTHSKIPELRVSEEQSLKSFGNWSTKEEFSTDPSNPNSGFLFHVSKSLHSKRRCLASELVCSTVTLLTLAKESILVCFEVSMSSKNMVKEKVTS